MSRTFEFSTPMKAQARLRQWGLCAKCGHSMNNSLEHAHHVVPDQIGRSGDPADVFLRSVDNCIVLCDGCHIAAHAHGDFRFGAVAPSDWFPYSHGKQEQAQHVLWGNRIALEWRRLSARR
jgi:hypothetical protein